MVVKSEPRAANNFTTSVSLKGSVGRHSIFLNFKKYERGLTALLAAMLSKTELKQLLEILKDRLGQRLAQQENDKNGSSSTDQQKLHVVKISELKTILSRDMKNDQM